MAQYVLRLADARFVCLIQTGHKILRDRTSVQKQQDKQMIFKTAHAPWSTGSVLGADNLILPIRTQTFNQFTEGNNGLKWFHFLEQFSGLSKVYQV